MEKYKGFNDITHQILNGDICKMDIHYEDEKSVKVHIEYKDGVFTYDYDMSINRESHKVDFIAHHSLGHFSETKLNRNIQFEEAISSFLFHA